MRCDRLAALVAPVFLGAAALAQTPESCADWDQRAALANPALAANLAGGWQGPLALPGYTDPYGPEAHFVDLARDGGLLTRSSACQSDGTVNQVCAFFQFRGAWIAIPDGDAGVIIGLRGIGETPTGNLLPEACTYLSFAIAGRNTLIGQTTGADAGPDSGAEGDTLRRLGTL